MGDIETKLKSCSYVQFLSPHVRDRSRAILNALYHISEELKSNINLGEHQVSFDREVRNRLCNISEFFLGRGEEYFIVYSFCCKIFSKLRLEVVSIF